MQPARFSRFSLLAWASFLLGPLAAWPHSAVEPLPRSEGWWKERHELLNRRVAEAGEKARLIILGDSITQGWEGAGQAVWERYYAPRHAVNLGIGGDRITGQVTTTMDGSETTAEWSARRQ